MTSAPGQTAEQFAKETEELVEQFEAFMRERYPGRQFLLFTAMVGEGKLGNISYTSRMQAGMMKAILEGFLAVQLANVPSNATDREIKALREKLN